MVEGGPFPGKIRPSDLVIIVALINASLPHSLALLCCQVTGPSLCRIKHACLFIGPTLFALLHSYISSPPLLVNEWITIS